MILLGDELEVVVVRKKIKNVYFRINEQLQIIVSCPKFITDAEINRLLKKNISSLEDMYKRAVDHKIVDDKIYFLGKKLGHIQFNRIMIDETTAYGPSIEAVNEYLEKNSLPYFQERLDLYTKEFPNLPKFRLRIRNMKTRWGVCNKSSMTVTLNSQLIHKDVRLIDYVIVHELSHFEHMDHSVAFWKCVESHYPEYKKARKELRY